MRFTDEELALRERWRNEALFMSPFKGDTINLSPQFIEWLAVQGADQLHEIASNWNWDSGSETLIEIINNPNCDRGTAMTIYGLSEPDGYEGRFIGDLDENDEIHKLFDAIVAGFEDGRFVRGDFPVFEQISLEELRLYRDKLIEAGSGLKWRLPDRAFQPLGTKRHKPTYTLERERLMIPFDEWVVGQR